MSIEDHAVQLERSTTWIPVTALQRALLERAHREGGTTNVVGREVGIARTLDFYGTVADGGKNGRGGNVSGKRWTFTLKHKLGAFRP